MMCSLCREHFEKGELRHFDIYAFGSEGIRVCHGCELGLVSYCQEQSRAALRRRKAEHKRSREAKK